MNASILSAFQKEFSSASHIEWNAEKDYARVIFVYNNSRVAAYYNYDGVLLGTARNITFSQLPLSLIKELSVRNLATAFYDITEVTKNDITNYYMTVEKKNKKFLVCASASGSMEIIKKIKE